MKKNLLWMLAAIFICGLTVTTLSACSSDDDDKTEGKTEVTMMYAVKVTDDVLKVADVEVNYIDQTGAKKKEKLGTTEWKKILYQYPASHRGRLGKDDAKDKHRDRQLLVAGDHRSRLSGQAGQWQDHRRRLRQRPGGKAHYRTDSRRYRRLVQPESYDKLCYRPDRL